MTATLGSRPPAAAGTDPGPALPTVHDAVLAHALTTPERTAVRDGGTVLTYAGLAAASARYATRLQQLGVRPGDIVPVCLPRSVELVAVLVAVLRCGAAYAAFDPRWPDERRADLVARVDAPVFVAPTGEHLPGRACWAPDPLDPSPDDVPAPAPVAVTPGDVACVFFTSGTTGAPKGVLSTHAATTRLFGPGGLPGFDAGAVVPQAAPSPWDAFNLELWGTLVSGGRSVVVEDDYLPPGALADLVRDDGVTTLWITASLFNMFVDVDIAVFAGLRTVYTGGERLSVPHVARFLAAHPDIALANAYGPVESCVFATVHPVREQDCDSPDGIPIGTAAPHTTLYLETTAGDVLPATVPGAAGEILVGGPGLATGYLRDPDQTAQKFATRDVDGVPTRLYRTGDLGTCGEDGVLRFRGRADRQIKVRGYRIEPGEIETVASALDGVARAVVVPVAGRSAATERLALFYTGDAGPVGGDGGDPLGIADRLFDRLPEYLVPDLVVGVPDLPLTPNGKLDAAALLTLLTRWDLV